MFCQPDQGLVTNYFCRMSLVMYLVYYNYSNAGPECQARDHVNGLSYESPDHNIISEMVK